MSIETAVSVSSISKVVDLLNDPDESKVLFLPPVTPKAGEVYLYDKKISIKIG